jgi:hypothetical protein
VKVDEPAAKIVERNQQQVLHGACRRLDRRGADRRRAAFGKEDSVDASRVRSAQQRADVLWILERVEDEHERDFPAFLRAAKDIIEGGPAARLDHQRHALMAVEPADRCQRPALDLHHGNAERSGVQYELLQGGTTLRHHEQSLRGTMCCERLSHGSASGHQLLVVREQIRLRQRLLPSSRHPRLGISAVKRTSASPACVEATLSGPFKPIPAWLSIVTFGALLPTARCALRADAAFGQVPTGTLSAGRVGPRRQRAVESRSIAGPEAWSLTGTAGWEPLTATPRWASIRSTLVRWTAASRLERPPATRTVEWTAPSIPLEPRAGPVPAAEPLI